MVNPNGYRNTLFTITLMPMVDGSAVHWFGESAIGSLLIEREEYRTLRDEVIQGWNHQPRQHTLVIGTAGIGKTMFLYYLMSYLRHRWEVDHTSWMSEAENASSPYELLIVYDMFEYGKGKSKQGKRIGYQFRVDVNGNATVTVSSGRGDLQASSHIYYLCDNVTPKLVNNQTLLVTSPNVDIYNPFCEKRTGGKVIIRHMGLISYEVMESMRPILFPHMTSDELRQRYGVVGGVLRPIQLNHTKEELLQRLKRKASQSTAEMVMSGMGGYQSMPEVLDALLHFIVDEKDDRQVTLDFPSQSVSSLADIASRLH